MSLILIHSSRFGDHLNPPGHPECAERAEVMEVTADRFKERGGMVLAPRAATREQLVRVHAEDHVDRIAKTSGRATSLDPDTYTSPDSYEVALVAAGAAVQAVELTFGSAAQVTQAFALVRPPGHHAERDRAMGFCLFNNVAIAAAHALALGTARVAIVDYDVHHGNGTQGIFYEDRRVLYVSLHQFPFYPGTGAATEVGRGAGQGFTVNAPFEAGATDDDWAQVLGNALVPILCQFAPELLLVSAGFDAHELDPLAGMRLTAAGFRRLTARLREAAETSCGGRMVLVTEGGYHLQALTACLEAAIEALTSGSDLRPPPKPSPLRDATGHGPTRRGAETLQAVVAAQKRFWKL
ncbi:MAG: histone deacetylase [Acidobacteria bacterium]|nr:histone deacetylase [Acidobacteriota bacterium]